MAPETRVIQTKLVPPIRDRGLVNRERLQEMLVDSTQRSLTLVLAPAGYGKTTVLGQWYTTLRSSGRLHAWYSLDESDSEIGQFFTYLVASLRICRPDFGTTVLDQLVAGVGLSPVSLAGALINELNALQEQCYLVLDDFHLLGDGPVQDAMREVVLRAPPTLHLAIASREAPPLPLGRLRALGRLAEINTEHLRFRGPEAGAFMSLGGHSRLSSAQVLTLEQRTEGWAVGLQLASLSLAAGETPPESIVAFSGSHRDVAEFLAEDVLRRQQPEIQEFLLCTSILDRFCPALCDALLGSGNGRAVLDQLEAKCLFIFSLDAEREWYRYHHLFSDFLRRRLGLEGARRLTDLHRRASRWFAAQGYFDEAIRHAILGRDTVRAAEYLNATCDGLFYSGRLGALAEWYAQIPAMHLRRHPRILLDQAWSLILEWRFEAARRILDDVHKLVGAEGGPAADDDGRLSAMLRHREMMYALFTDEMHAVDALCREMIGGFPVPDPYLQGSLYTCLIFSQREMLNFDSLDYYDARARKLYEESGSRFVFVWHDSIVGPTELARGNLDRAEAALSSARRIAAEVSGEHSPLAAMPALLLAEVFYERNQVDAAQWLLEQYLPLADRIGFVDQLIAGYVLHARLLAAAGQSGAATDLLARGDGVALRQGFERLAVHIMAERLRKALAEGDVDTIRAVTQQQFAHMQVARLAPGEGTGTRQATMAMSWCRIARTQERTDEAVALCRNWIAFARARGAQRIEALFGTLLAGMHEHKGERPAAVRAMRAALAVAHKAGLVRSIIDQPEAGAGLLQAVAEAGGTARDAAAAWARHLLNLKYPGAAAAGTGGRAAAGIEPLSDREREILQLVAKGFRNQEIGARLGLTEGTVKWHLQHIFDKVGTRRRMQVVEHIRRLGLLD